MTTKQQPLAEIAARIDAHLRRFEADYKARGMETVRCLLRL